jgi:hypothetical protein
MGTGSFVTIPVYAWLLGRPLVIVVWIPNVCSPEW